MRSVLAPLTLRGLGTPAVESLASYFMRLATAHQVTPAQLAKVVCNDSGYLSVAGAPALNGCDLYPAMLCSYSEQTKVLAQRLQKLTGVHHLACGTLLPLGSALCQNQSGAIVRSRRWCPQCYAEAAGDFAEPLAWSLPLVASCPTHHVALEDSCPHCGWHQRDWRTGQQRRMCGKCGRPLTNVVANSATLTPWDAWCQINALKILQHVGTPDAPNVCPSAFEVFLEAVPESAITWRNRSGSMISNLRIDRRKRPCARARLNTIFRVAALWGATPLDILLRPTEAASPALFDAAASLPDPPRVPRYSMGRLDRCKQKFAALLALPAGTRLPSAEGVCLGCNVNSETFRRHYREVMSTYVSERRSRQAHRLDRQIATADKYVRVLLARLRENGERLHRKNTVAAMMADIHVPKAIARSALRTAIAGLRVERNNGGRVCAAA